MEHIFANVPFSGWFTSSRGEGELVFTGVTVKEHRFIGMRGRYHVDGTYPLSAIEWVAVRANLFGIVLSLLAIACVPASFYWYDPWFAYGAWGFWTLAHRYNGTVVVKTRTKIIRRTTADRRQAFGFKDAVERALIEYRTYHRSGDHEVLR